MNATDTNSGGYNASGMKTYLTGNYWAGLQTAGVPEGVVWAPARKVGYGSNRSGGVQDISDKLWLPTEWEIVGNTDWSENPSPTSANQGRLAYYNNADALMKYNSANSNDVWWIADTAYFSVDANFFCNVKDDVGGTHARSAGGCAPAFCVK